MQSDKTTHHIIVTYKSNGLLWDPKNDDSGSEANVISEPPWGFYKSLTFLDPSFEICSSISNSFKNIINFFT